MPSTPAGLDPPVARAFVADSSVGVSWAVASQASPAAERLLDEMEAGGLFLVPALWPFEVANALLFLRRRKKITPAELERAQAALSRMNPRVDWDGLASVFGTTAALAQEHALSVYDAAYLELALRSGLPLASRDAALNRAARRTGIETLL